MADECGCLGGAVEAGFSNPVVVVLGLFTVLGIFYSVFVATMVGQRIWQRHDHVLAKRMLTKNVRCHIPGTLCMWTGCITCFEGCGSMAGECGCLGGAGEAGLPLLLIMGLIVLGLFTVIGIFYSVLVATMVGQRIWQRHYHILVATMEYVLEDVDGGEMADSDRSPSVLPPEHIQELKTLGLL